MIWINSRTPRTIRIEEVGSQEDCNSRERLVYTWGVQRLWLTGLNLCSLLASSTKARDGSQGKHQGDSQTEYEKLSAGRYIIQIEKGPKGERTKEKERRKRG